MQKTNETTQNCPNCQFEGGKHSFDCPMYKAIDFQDYLAEQLKDPKFKKEYDKLKKIKIKTLK